MALSTTLSFCTLRRIPLGSYASTTYNAMVIVLRLRQSVLLDVSLIIGSWLHVVVFVSIPRRAAFVHLSSADELSEVWGRIIDVVNVPLYQEWENDTKVAIDNVRNRLCHTRFQKRTLPLVRHFAYPLVEPYFTRLAPTPKSDPLVYSLANNGWAADPLHNFPRKLGFDAKLGDCVKLRYGAGPDDNPWLWSHMASYVTSLASMFDGFRIDRALVSDAARVVNPDLYVSAELFTGSEEMHGPVVRQETWYQQSE